MRYGIISDIHANLEALEVVLDFLKDVEAVICLGDVVGYGPNPNECCGLVRERCEVTILGNHDAAAAGNLSLEWFNPYAREAVEWTADQLTDVNLDFLRRLRLTYRTDDFVAVHGSLNRAGDFEYITSPWSAMPTFGEMDPYTLCFVGHTHNAEFYFQRKGEFGADSINMADGGVVDLKPDFRYIVNCGSVGQPRDHNPRAAVGIYDTEADTVTIHRLEYPIEVTQEKMRAAGLPRMLWDRLMSGT